MKRMGCLIALTVAGLAAGCSGGGSSDSSSTTQPSPTISLPSFPTSSLPSRNTVLSWAEKWCSFQPGGTPADLEALMGSPTEKYEDQAQWNAYEWRFTAFFSADGTVRQMDINDIQLSESQKAALACESARIAP